MKSLPRRCPRAACDTGQPCYKPGLMSYEPHLLAHDKAEAAATGLHLTGGFTWALAQIGSVEKE